MADDVKKGVEVAFTSTGAERLTQLMDKLDKELRTLNQTGAITDKQFQQGSKGLGQFGRAVRETGQATAGAAQQTKQAATATSNMAGNLPRLRYALYDVSSTLAITGAAMTALATATGMASITMDREFADVVRTTGTYLDSTGTQTAALRSEFNQLFSTLPKSWSDLTDIGTLAGQLGIASNNVAEFTSLVAKFASVTDVTVEASATAFGRLSQLLNVSASEYENLGSSILAVGVSSVSTESQIINISSQIASMGDFAGLSADEVIGFSSALASLGVQPELSRGTITRLFTNLANAADVGGEKLEAFARTAGMSADDFAKAWRDDATGAIMSLLQGLDRVDAAGGSAITTLREMGITSVRDVPTMLKLAQNYEFVGEQLQIASDGYKEGTALQEQYGVVALTTAERLTLLGNNIKLFIGNLAETDGVLAEVVDGITTLVAGMSRLADNDVFQVITGVTLAVTALGGVLLITAGGAARMGASFFALRTALIDSSVAAGTFGTTAAASTAIAEKGFLRTAVSIKAVRTALISSGIGAAIVALGTAWAYFEGQTARADERLNAFRDNLSSAIATDTEAGDDSLRSFTASLDGATASSDAAKKETQDLALEMVGLKDQSGGASTGVSELKNEIDDLTLSMGAASEQAIRTALADLILGDSENANEQRQRIEEINAGLQSVGLTYEDVVQGIISGNGLPAALAELQDQLTFENVNADQIGISFDKFTAGSAAANLNVGNFIDSLEDYNGVTQNTIELNATQAALYGELGAEIPGAAEAAAAAAGEFDELGTDVESATEAIFGMLNLQSSLNSALYDLGASVRENGSSFDSFSASGRANMQSLQAVFAATADWASANGVTFESAIGTVGNAMVQAGVISVQQLQALGVAGVNFGNDLLSVAEATSQAVAALQGQMSALNSGVGTGADFGRVGAGLQRVATSGLAAGDSAGKAVLQFSRLNASGLDVNDMLGQVTDGWNDSGDAAKGSGGKQSKAAKDAAREVRTLTDYVSDLSSLFGSAFEFRFEFGQSRDDTTSAFRDIVQSFEDARQRVRDLRLEIQDLKATMGSLRADIGLLEYQYTVAVEYGDVLRQQEITAELAEKNADLAKTGSDLSKTEKELAKARQSANADLTSNTDGAIEQRSAVLDLVQAYQGQIEAYANTGASQKQVEQYTRQLQSQFKQQLTQLGYNKREVENYSGAFNDMVTIIRQTPKNVTVSVTASTSPAERAIREFQANARKSQTAPVNANTSNANRAVDALRKKASSPVSFRVNAAGNAGKDMANEFVKTVKSKQRATGGGGGAGNYRMFASGGFTGQGAKYEPAGVVHRGEYVVPKHQVNQSTGLPYADAFNRLARGQSAPSYANGGHVRGPSSMMVELSPTDRNLLRKAGNVSLMLNGQVVAQATNGYNERKGAYST